MSGRDAMADDGFVQQRPLRLGMVIAREASKWRLVKARPKIGARSREHVIYPLAKHARHGQLSCSDFRASQHEPFGGLRSNLTCLALSDK